MTREAVLAWTLRFQIPRVLFPSQGKRDAVVGGWLIRTAGKQKQTGGGGQRDCRDPVMAPPYRQGL